MCFAQASCDPLCRWVCDDPQCMAQCHPICKQPQCQMHCDETPCAKCHTVCPKPVCTVRCPKDMCARESCPECETVCQESTCTTKCTAAKPHCKPVCADSKPDCQWRCKKPTTCPKPKCLLVCQKPECGNIDAGNGPGPCCECAVSGNAMAAVNQAHHHAQRHGQPHAFGNRTNNADNNPYPSFLEVMDHMRSVKGKMCCPCADKSSTSRWDKKTSSDGVKTAQAKSSENTLGTTSSSLLLDDKRPHHYPKVVGGNAGPLDDLAIQSIKSIRQKAHQHQETHHTRHIQADARRSARKHETAHSDDAKRMSNEKAKAMQSVESQRLEYGRLAREYEDKLEDMQANNLVSELHSARYERAILDAKENYDDAILGINKQHKHFADRLESLN